MSRPIIFACAIAALAMAGGPAVAQVGGRVTDSAHRPLPAVAVELWVGGRPAAVRRTAADGSFRFDDVQAATPVLLRAEMLGYMAVQMNVTAPAADLRLELVPIAVQLEGITASAPPKLQCPNRDEPEARDLWRRLRAAYASSGDTLGISFYSRRHDATASRPGEVPPDEREFVHSWYGVQGRVRQANPRHAQPYQYAYPISYSFDPAYARWRYRDLATTDAGHFIAESFGASHSFSIVARNGESTTIGFCPAGPSTRGASIRGTLTGAPAVGLTRAEWTFQTRGPSEEAGCEVSFVPRGGEPAPLLPARTLFWRKLVGRDLYFLRWEHFVAYEFLPPDVMPERPASWLFVPPLGARR